MLDPVKRKVANTRFKNIRNRIRKLNGEELLEQLLRVLHHPDAGQIERLQDFEIWNLLLLVKWTILYGSSTDKYGVKPVTNYEIIQLMNRLKDLSAYVRQFNSLGDIYLFIRATAFQQLWIQRKEYIGFDAARQFLLFGKLDKNHAFQDWFELTTGVSMQDFMELSWGLYARVLGDRNWSVTEDYFSTVEDKYQANTVSRFLHSISHTVLGAREWLRQHDANIPQSIRAVEFEYFQPTPFARYPLIRHEENYFVISPDLLLNCLTELVYDLLKSDYGGKFVNRFGRLFEELVRKSIQSVTDRYLTESDLKRHFKNRPNQRLIDFIVVSDDCNVFVEAKAVTMSVRGMVTDQPRTVRSQTKPVLDGIEQAYAIADALPTGEEVCGLRLGKRDNYLIVVTFKDLFLGNGQLYRDHIAPTQTDKIISKYGGEELIPMSNVFIVSIDDFDTLLGSVRNGTKSLVDYLESAASRVRASGDWVSFRQLVLAEGNGLTMLPYLEEASDELYRSIKSKLKP